MQLLRNHHRTHKGFFFLFNVRGQSMVEYVAVLTALFLIAGLGKGAISQLGETIKQKYRSYCFSVAISDPPQKDSNQLFFSKNLCTSLYIPEHVPLKIPAAPDSSSIKDFLNQAENL